MGFFDRFRKTGVKTERRNNFIPEIVSAYGLRRARPYEPSIGQDWWEGYYGTMRFAVQEHRGGIIVYVGDVVEVTEIYLGRIRDRSKLPPKDSPQRLDRIAGTDGAEIAALFVLLATPAVDFDYPQLRLPELHLGIPRLSRSVEEIAIYENFRGLFFILNQPISRSDFENDLRIASEIVRALSSDADKTP